MSEANPSSDDARRSESGFPVKPVYRDSDLPTTRGSTTMGLVAVEGLRGFGWATHFSDPKRPVRPALGTAGLT